MKELKFENSFGKKFDKTEKVDVIMGADVIFWPESLDGLLQTLDVSLDQDIKTNIIFRKLWNSIKIA